MGNKPGKALTYHGNDRDLARMAQRSGHADDPPLPSLPLGFAGGGADASRNSEGMEEAGSGGLHLSDFELNRSVGRGSFGRVMLVTRCVDQKVFALKYISKSQCVRQKAVRNIINERRILQRLSHPLVCNLQAAFQDDEHMYIMLDPMMGGDLAFHLERCEYFPEAVVKHYICEVALALRYLHRQRIVHRDVKPANVLLDERGHCHLTDFNVAGRIRRDRPMKSLAGTYAYMAPEVYRQKGYYESVDWWSLGVLMFELLYGKPPFRGKSKRSIGESVLKHQISYPKRTDQKISPLCTDAMLSFLEPHARDRLGCKYRPFKEHPYFSDVSWDKVENKQLSAPFQPDPSLVKTDALYHLEEVLLHEAPLQQKRRKKNVKPKVYPPDSPWQIMLDEFKDFDRDVWEKQRKEEERLRREQHQRQRVERSTASGAGSASNATTTTTAAAAAFGGVRLSQSDEGERAKQNPTPISTAVSASADAAATTATATTLSTAMTVSVSLPPPPPLTVVDCVDAKPPSNSESGVLLLPGDVLGTVRPERRMKLAKSHADLRHEQLQLLQQADDKRRISESSSSHSPSRSRPGHLTPNTNSRGASGMPTPEGTTFAPHGQDYLDFEDDFYEDIGNYGEEEEEEGEEEECDEDNEEQEDEADRASLSSTRRSSSSQRRRRPALPPQPSPRLPPPSTEMVVAVETA